MKTESDEKLISVCISSYNYSGYLKHALEVLAEQKDDANFEIVISDDASKDDSCEMVQQFIKNHPDMDVRLYVNSCNEGILKNKSHLIEHAEGKYILFCDSDDVLCNDAIKSLADQAEEKEPDCVVCYVEDVDSNGKCIQVQDVSPTPSKWMVSLLHGSLYKRSIIAEHGLYFDEMPEDACFNLHFHQFSEDVVYFRKPVYRWLVNDHSEARKKKTLPASEMLERFAGNCETFKAVMDGCDAKGVKFSQKPGRLCGTERDEIEYELMKIYYGELLMANLRTAPGERILAWKQLKAIMTKACPDYLKNPNLNTKNKSIARKYATKIIRYCAKAERMGMMGILLRGYYLLRRFVDFDQ